MDNVTGGSGDTVTLDGRPRHVSGYLRDFLFPPERLHAPVSMLSGGERNRLLLARLFAQPSNLLVMDEPTNDLDAETLELLEEMVANYAGTLLLVSHDRAFLDNVVTSTLVFEGGGRINEYVGGYSDWVRQRKTRAPKSQASVAAGARTEAPDTAAAEFVARRPAVPGLAALAASAAAAAPAQARRLSYKEQRELTAMPEKIQRLELEQAELQAAIADPALFQGNDPRGAAALQKLQSLAAELESAYARWDALETRGASDSAV
jgi:ATP-binding cassette subfamily F protein uup